MSEGPQVLTVKNWHALLILVSWLVLSTMAFANLRSQSNENERRINELESRPNVSLQQFQDGQRNIEQRLVRIENKLDAADARRH
jgi:hypothetical protein